MLCNIKAVSFTYQLENFTLDWIFYTTSGCDGCDKYEVCNTDIDNDLIIIIMTIMMMMVILWQQYLPSSDLTTTRLTSNPEKKISCLWDDGVRCNVCEKPNDIKCPRLTHGQISFELKGTLPPVRYGSRSSTETSKQREGSIHHVLARSQVLH